MTPPDEQSVAKQESLEESKEIPWDASLEIITTRPDTHRRTQRVGVCCCNNDCAVSMGTCPYTVCGYQMDTTKTLKWSHA